MIRLSLLPVALLNVAWAESVPAACELVTHGEVQTAVLRTVESGSPRVNAENVTSCLFKDARGGAVSVLFHNNVSQEWIAQQTVRMSGTASFRPVSSVGDTAFVLDRDERGAAICLFRKGSYLQVSAFGLGDANSVVPGITDLARKALRRLDDAMSRPPSSELSYLPNPRCH